MEKRKEVKCTVVSFVPFDILEYKPGLVPPAFQISASDGKEPQVLHVGHSLHYVYLDDTRGSLGVEGPSERVAESIVEDYCSSLLGAKDGARPAIFWVPGEYTAEEVKLKFQTEIGQAKISQHLWFTNCCRIADDDWAKYHQHNVVSSVQRKMADILGWKPEQHEWMTTTSSLATESCFACHASIRPGQKICQVCKAILDVETNPERKLVFAGQ